MTEGTHIEVRELSPHLRAALESVRYGARDVRVIPTESVESGSSAGAGSRGFATAVNLDTGERRTITGDWGGSGLGRHTLDLPGQRMNIPPNGAVIKGAMGYPRTYATVYAHPTAFGRMLPSGEPADELSDADQQAIYCFTAIKGGEYRRDEMRRRGVTAATVDSLVERGYLKRNRAGATQITTKGKNARTVRY